MLHSFMIISGRGGIVLYRKVLTKSVNQPRLIAGLVSALCKFSTGSVGLPITTIELDLFTISIVELPVDDLSGESDYLRAVLFHDTSDGDTYGHVLGLELLNVFKSEYGERLLSMQLANVELVEQIFRPFGARIRSATRGSVRPLMQSLEANGNIDRVFLLRHRAEGAFSKTLDRVWYASGVGGTSLLPDVQALLSAGDDVLSKQKDEVAKVTTVGEYIRIERLNVATLVVVTQAPATCTECQVVIEGCTRVLKELFVLMAGLEGSGGLV